MLEKNGVHLLMESWLKILNHMTQDLVVNSGRNLIIEQTLHLFLTSWPQIDDSADSGSDYSTTRDGQLLLIMIFIMVIRCSKAKYSLI